MAGDFMRPGQVCITVPSVLAPKPTISILTLLATPTKDFVYILGLHREHLFPEDEHGTVVHHVTSLFHYPLALSIAGRCMVQMP